MIGGFMGSIDPKVDISVLARKFDADFHSFRGFVFAERPTAIRNETGLYTGIQIRPNTKWLVSGYVDQFWFPWHRFNVSYPSQGQEYMVQIDYRPKRSMWLYARWRSDHKQRNAQDPDNLETLQYIVPTAKRAIRLHFQKSFDRVFTVRTRMERSWYRQGEQENSTGFLLYQDLVWKVNWKFDITMRYAIFDVTDYNARIYAFENDVLGFFSIPAYSDKGSRYYLVLNYKPSRNVEFWLRLAQWHYRHEKTVGSGLGEINGDTKTEVKFQVRFRL